MSSWPRRTMSNWRIAVVRAARLLLIAMAFAGSACKGPESIDRGAQLYTNLCQSCHQSNGTGARGLYAPLAGTPVAVGDPKEMLGWVMYGIHPVSLPRGQFAGAMPQFNFLSDADAAAVTSYVRRSFGNHALAIEPNIVAEVRAAHVDK